MHESWQETIAHAAERLRGTAGDGSDAQLQSWCRRHAPDAIRLDHERLTEVSAGGTVSLPGTLERAPDPQALLEGLAATLRPGGGLVAAVRWQIASSPTDRRSFHPASLIGLLVPWYAVEELHATDGLLGARARVEPDPGKREAAADAALLSVQGAVEAVLDRAPTDRAAVDAWCAAVSGLERALIATDEARHTARTERNEARRRLRDARAGRDAAEQQVRALSDRVASLEMAVRQRDEELARIQRVGAERRRRMARLLRRTPGGARLVVRLVRRRRPSRHG